ncbi:MAG: DUF4360 domain-containing protein [Pseudobdellovibrionaceae bacterium]
MKQKNEIKNLILSASMLGLLLISAAAGAQTTPPNAAISTVDVVGNGCSAANTSITLSPDFKDLSVLFDNYSVEIGQGSNITQTQLQKNCQIRLRISIPANWSFAFKAIDYRGFAALPASSWGFHRFTYINSLQQVSSMREATIKGPFNQDYQVHIEQKPERMVWTPCGLKEHPITLYSQLGVSFLPRSTDRSLAQLALDSADLSVKQSFSMVWRQCK